MSAAGCRNQVGRRVAAGQGSQAQVARSREPRAAGKERLERPYSSKSELCKIVSGNGSKAGDTVLATECG